MLLDIKGRWAASVVLNIYFVGSFSALYLWCINIQCTRVSQVRYVSQGIQEKKTVVFCYAGGSWGLWWM